jgi:hypothetical protein
VKEISTITPHRDSIDGPTSGNHSSFVMPIAQTQPVFVDNTLSTPPTVTPFTEAPPTTLPPIMLAMSSQSLGHTNAVTAPAALAGRKPTATFGQSALSGANAADLLLSDDEYTLFLRMQNEGRSFDTIVTALRVAREVRRQDNVDSVQTTEQPPEYNLRQS